MLRDLLSKTQSNSDQGERQESREPTRENFNASTTKPHKDDDEFVPVNHEDVEDVDNEEDESEMEPVLRSFLGLHRQGQRSRVAAANKYDDLHPYTQILSLSNLEACVALEYGAFPEHERCSRDKVRLAPSLHRSIFIFDANLGFPKKQWVTFLHKMWLWARKCHNNRVRKRFAVQGKNHRPFPVIIE